VTSRARLAHSVARRYPCCHTLQPVHRTGAQRADGNLGAPPGRPPPPAAAAAAAAAFLATSFTKPRCCGQQAELLCRPVSTLACLWGRFASLLRLLLLVLLLLRRTVLPRTCFCVLRRGPDRARQLHEAVLLVALGWRGW
jgi:hypothetical protein